MTAVSAPVVGRIDLSGKSLFKIFAALTLFLMLYAGAKMASARGLALIQSGTSKVTAAVGGGAPVAAQDPRYAGL